MVILYEQEILVITPLFPDPKYDILIMISAKTDFTHQNMNSICCWSEGHGCKLQEIMEAAN